jgi:hypothetical protein
MTKHEAFKRRQEIARKTQAQKLQSSGYVPSQLAKLTRIDRLIECDHYKLTGKAAQIYYAKEQITRLKNEVKKSKPSEIINVKAKR